MSEAVFNMDDGYFEGIIRGFRGGILKRGDYLNLCQCETLEGVCSCAMAILQRTKCRAVGTAPLIQPCPLRTVAYAPPPLLTDVCPPFQI